MSDQNYQDTVREQKTQFLRSKTYFLSRGIDPSTRLKRIAVDGGLELSVLKGVLDKVNRELKQHARRVYSRQMSEHVVEQIDNFYWTSGARDVDADGPSATSDLSADAPVSQSDDLTQDDVIAKLPSRWDTSADRPRPPSSRDVVPIDQDDYLSAVIRLQALSARRLTLQHRLNTYRTLLALLEPYRRPKENVQPNLVWRDSPLAPELARTRTLAIRVAGRVDEGRASGRFPEVQVPATADEDEDSGDVWRDDGQAKVKRVLESW